MKHCLEFPGAKQKPKNSRGFQKSMSSNPPVFFSGIVHYDTGLIGGTLLHQGEGVKPLLFTHIPNIFAVNIL